MVHAADIASLIVLRDLLVDGGVKETMEVSSIVGASERECLTGLHESEAECLLVVILPTDALPMYFVVELFNTLPSLLHLREIIAWVICV